MMLPHAFSKELFLRLSACTQEYIIQIFKEYALLWVIQWYFFRQKLHMRDAGNFSLKVQSCKSYNNKYMIALTQITNTEVFTFIAVLVLKLLSRKVLFINRKDNRNCQKVGYFLRKQQISRVNCCKIKNSWNAKFSGYF